MCFSAPVSFGASAALAAVGCALVSRIKSRRYLPLALIPFFFAVQQAAEGVIWLSLPKSSPAQTIFLFFAYAIWPVWIPFSLYLVESSKKKRKALAGCLALGVMVAATLFLEIPDIHATAGRYNIHYLQHFQWSLFSVIKVSFYLLATIPPFFISSLKKIWIAGLLLLLSALITYLINALSAISVWCFFAALFSLALLFILKRQL
ncbi:MAG: hypothetical protein HYX48_02830 [Chlamydiales bacterium]|nr:hypothetical protein [Chlamydiales bacterium]